MGDAGEGSPPDLYRLSAQQAVALLRRGEVSPVEMIESALARIEAVDHAINALPTVCEERALQRARSLEYGGSACRQERARDRGWLGGLPIVVKDVTDVAQVRCTFGSRIYAERVPARSDIAIENLERHGAIVIAKSNTPAFASSGGIGTYNDLFGVTRNPWSVELTCGGSSGGSAAALAAGEAWLATGTDLGGSLRQPAAFCSVVGLRPTPGRVARSEPAQPDDRLCVVGPMARTVGDVALMLDAMSGIDERDPISLPAPAVAFSEQAEQACAPSRIAFSPTLDLCPVSAEVAALCEQAVMRFAGARTQITSDCPDLLAAKAVLDTLRPAWLAAHWAHLLDYDRDRIDAGFAERLERGLQLDPERIRDAQEQCGALSRRAIEFFQHYDVLATPTAPVAPFPADTQKITEIDGRPLIDDSDWMLLTYAISLTGCPAISIPCGFTDDGRPVGLQLVAAPGRDGELLAAAGWLERRLQISRRTPVEPRTGSHEKPMPLRAQS
ncbi:MAG TPA: amidase [Burkholderiales bacterium]|nr:amidase [Burkholderiales bacterium]